MRLCLHPLVLIFLPLQFIFPAREDGPEFIDPNIIEMAPFVVYGGIIDTIDGFTELEYHENDAVVLGFREEFNNLLLGFHKKLLIDEHNHMTRTLEIEEGFHADLNSISASFGIRPVERRKDMFHREKAITNRLVKDPFFIIDALIVWDADRLERYKERLPHSKYSKDIRFNKETGQWERRITTKWEVFFVRTDGRNPFYTEKFQGLNLDTNKGYHLIENGLPDDIVPHAFQKVNLTYPIFVNSYEPAAVQIERLQKTLIANLYQIYDPYSWIARRNLRFRIRGKFQGDFKREMTRVKLPVTDRNWFDTVLSNLILDIVTMKYYGPAELYDHEMLQKIAVNKNLLGTGFDLLNWNEGENRSIDYDPTRNNNVGVNFNNAGGARWVMVDAYRRYGMQVLDLIRQELNTLAYENRTMSGKQLVKKVLSQVTGTKADNYIKLAEKAQKQELEKFRYVLK